MTRQVLSGIIAGAVFVLFYFLFSVSFFFALAMGVASYIGGIFLFPKNFHREKKILDYNPGDTVSPRVVSQTIAEGEEKVYTIKKLASKIKDTSVRNKINDICGISHKIFENFKKDPKDIRLAKKFLVYYLDATLNIVQKYKDLSFHKNRSPEVDATLKQAETLLNTIHSAFEEQLAKLLENDMLDLSVEMDVLEKTLKMEGFK